MSEKPSPHARRSPRPALTPLGRVMLLDRDWRVQHLHRAPGPCAFCGEPATCFGTHADPTGPPMLLCDDCCSHGRGVDDEGWCDPIEEGP